MYTAILWGYEDDMNSVDPLEASSGDIDYWIELAQNGDPRFIEEIRNNTGLWMDIYKGDVPTDAPWDGDYVKVANAYVGRTWPVDKILAVAARLAGTEPQNIILKRA